jgi:lipopolysaccharide transport system ATP-binding protein
VLAVGDAEFQRKCLGKMSDVARQGRTVMFVSHNMSAILRLTEEALVIDHGQLALRAPTGHAVDYYLSGGFSQEGQRNWTTEEIPAQAAPFRPISMRIKSPRGQVVDTIRAVEPFSLEIEYVLDAPITGLRVGIYLLTAHGEVVFTSFDLDDPESFNDFTARKAGHYVSTCQFPPNLFNEGRYVIGINASSYHIKRYFQDDQAMTFSVDATGAAGTQWVETRLGSIRPMLEWKIEGK